MQRQKASPYATFIGEATGAPKSKLALLEGLMREEIFHSTLDWQGAAQLAEGARQAYVLYRSAPAYYDGIEIHQRAHFRLVQLEARLEKARRFANPAKIAEIELRVQLARDTERLTCEAIPHLAVSYGL